MIYYGFAVLALCLSPLVVAIIGAIRSRRDTGSRSTRSGFWGV